MKLESVHRHWGLVRQCFSRLGAILLQNLELLVFTAILYYKSYRYNLHVQLGYNDVFPVACLGSILVLAGMAMFFRRRGRSAVLLVMNLLASLLMIADIVYFRYYNDVLSVPVFAQARLADPALKSSVMQLFKGSDLLFLADLLILVPAAGIAMVKTKMPEMHLLPRLAAGAAVLVIGSSMVWYGMASLNRMMGNTSFTNVYDHSYFICNVGFIGYHGFDACFYFKDNVLDKRELSEAEKDKIRASFTADGEKGTPGKLAGAGKGKNLIVIQVEAMQNLVIGMKAGGREVTPNLNRFIKRSLYFDRYFSQVGQGNTADAEFISNNSFYPLREGAVYFRCANSDFASLPSALKEHGYSTAAMHAYKASFWNRATIYPVLGFDQYFSQKSFRNDERVGWGLADRSFLRQSLEKMKGMQQPFYSFMITLTSHYPYEAFDLKGELGKEFDAGEYQDMFFGTYLRAMHYADRALGEFLEGLEESGLMDNSVVVVYGDHEGLKKGNLDEIRNSLRLPADQDLACVKMRNVPLIIHLPGDQATGKRSLAGGQVDLFPTLANIFGLEPGYRLGEDLVNAEKGCVYFRDGSVTDGKTVYLKKYDSCFDLNTGKAVDRSVLAEYIDKAKHELELSDTVLENNLLSEFKD